MRPFLPKRLEPVLFGLLVTFIMTMIVSGISTLLAVGFRDPQAGALWVSAWMTSWAVAFPVILFVAPLVRNLLHRIVRRD